ncbi:MAG: 50S ribosomal protein L10, partial [Planctomycetes bacterium]|nr:50S ribosomal protein L10 [Planctomycetota bacterium]
MSKFIKELMVKDLQKRFGELTEFLVVSTIGIEGNDNNEMRGAMLEKGIKVSIVKNSVMRQALVALEKSNVTELFAAGPCAIAYGGDSVVDVAKEVELWAKKLSTLRI